MSSNFEGLVLWKRLTPGLGPANHEKLQWRMQTYPKLKYFSYHLDEELKVTDELCAFFNRNQSIEKFSLLSSNVQTVRQCVEKGIEINELFLKLTGDMTVNLTVLKDFCGDHPSRRLHLLVYSTYALVQKNNLELFMSLKPNIDGLYFEEQSYFEDELVDAVKTFDQLKVLQITPTHRSFVVSLIAGLPLLEEFYIYDNLYANENVDIDWFPKQTQIVSSLISGSKKLKKIFLWRTHNTLQFEEYDRQRKQLDGAEKLTVFLGLIGAHPMYRSLFDGMWNVDSFEVVRTERKHIRNPLVKYFC